MAEGRIGHLVVAPSEEFMSLRTYLELRIVVQVDMHNRKNWDPPHPVVRRMSLSLPSGLTLAVEPQGVMFGRRPHDPFRT